jgi:histidinol-phosphatase (PHP family)
MLQNLHTHSTFCDGKNTPEEIVLSAIEKKFDSIGFSGHAYTPYDLRYCMKDTEGYEKEILQLKEKYAKEIRIFLGTEEDAFAPVRRERYDYIIGSCHYLFHEGEYLPIDSSPEHFDRCLAACGEDLALLAERYYGAFCGYIRDRRPDIIGHFDLITKYDEFGKHSLLADARYRAVAEKYLLEAAKAKCIFEVNTGAISRGLRTAPYPSAHLLHILKKENAAIALTADSHKAETIDGGFAETRRYLYDLGFRSLYMLTSEGFTEAPIRF